jgi:Flp pilus assembly protein TadB
MPEYLSQYPELFAFAAVALVLVAVQWRRKTQSAGNGGFMGTNLSNNLFGNGPLYLPVYLTNPATEILRPFPAYLEKLQTKLNYCGFRGNTQLAFLASAKLYPALLSTILWAFVNQPLIVLGTAVFLFFAPDLVITVLAGRRKTAIREALPELLDLMVLCVDAGLGLDATLTRVAQEKQDRNDSRSNRKSSPLAEELLTLNRDILLGMSRERAFQELYKRTGVEELGAFAGALNQANQLGLSISKTLRNQSEYLRTKLSQKAEEKAARLPIYMAFPLWFCIMPALMVLVLAPSLLIFFQHVKPGGILP